MEEVNKQTIITWLNKYSPQAIINHLVNKKGYTSAQANEIVNSIAQPTTIAQQPAQQNESYKSPKSKLISIRLPLDLYEIVKDSPTEKIKQAIKMSYNKPSVQ